MVRKTRKNNKKKLLLTFIPLALVVVGGLFLFIHYHHRTVSGTIPSTIPAQAKKASTNASANSGSAAGTNDAVSPKAASSAGGSGSVATDSSASATALLAPFGAFVSNHSPNLDGSPAPSAEQSVCNTTAGASCSIKFVNSDGIVKTLSAQTTDSSGATYWNWDVNKSGFSVGSWTITATASLNGQTKSANDSLTLNIQS